MQLQPPASISRHKRLSCPSVKPHAQGAAGVCSLRPHLREFGSPRRPRDSVLLRQAQPPGSTDRTAAPGSNGLGNEYSNGYSNGYTKGVEFVPKPYSNGQPSSPATKDSAQQVAGQLAPVQPIIMNAEPTEEDGVADPCDVGHLSSCAANRRSEQEASSSGADPEEERNSGVSNWKAFRKFSTWRRTFAIWSFAFKFLVRYWLLGKKFTYGKQGMTTERMAARKAKLASWLRQGLIRLGPTFIKIGQQFSTRVDVLAPEFVKELEKLQDRVPSFPSKEAIAIVEEGLGAPVTSIYDSFDPKPIAAASLGQVHLARLKGEEVVVKVQRPGLRELFSVDLKNIRALAVWLQAADPKSDGAARDWVAIYDECSKILYEEIDYELEGRNAERFKNNFAKTPWVKVPRIYWSCTSTKVLTMEYVPGVKINQGKELDRLGVDRTLLAQRAVESYLQQLLTFGFFHADPHPGNIAVDVGETGGEKGRLIYYDYGMMGTIPSDIRSGLLELFYGVYEKDPDRCIDALVVMGVLAEGGDRQAIRRTAEFFLKTFQDRLDAQKAERASKGAAYDKDFKPQATKDEKGVRRKEIVANIGEDLLVAAADKPFRFPATFTFVVRSFSVLDGIGKSLSPRFDITEISAPYARGLLLEGAPQKAALQKELKKRLGKQDRAFKNLFRSPNMLEDVALTTRALERGDLKLRVRALEAERALNRVQIMQKVMTSTLAACTLVNVGTVLSVSALGTAASASFVGAGGCSILTLINWLKVRQLEKKEAMLTGSA